MALQWEQLSNLSEESSMEVKELLKMLKNQLARLAAVYKVQKQLKQFKVLLRQALHLPQGLHLHLHHHAPTPAPRVSNINNFDRTAGGAGSQKGTDRLSASDLKNLRGQGHSLQDIVNYADKSYAGGAKGGQSDSKSGRLLAQYKEELKTRAVSTYYNTPEPPAPPTQGSTGPSAPNPGDYQSDYDPNEFFNNGNNQTNESVNNSSNTEGNGVSVNQSNSQNTQIYQDNDLINTINGNNNNVDNNVDNSVNVQNGSQSNSSSINGRFAGDALADAMEDGTLSPTPSATSKEYSMDVNDNNYAKAINSNQGNDQNTDVYQDNDIINTVNGDNNRIENNVDNSIRNYGGNQKNFTYVGGENPLLDTPVSAGTMAGYFHDDDSPAKSAGFVDRYETMNRDSAKRRQQFGAKSEDFIYKGSQIGGFNVRELDKHNRRGPQIARDRAKNMALNLFGDRYAASVKGWESPERQSGVEQPDWDDLYDKYTDF
jgi:hypothetical protein